ncbi:MAG: hypothetical protein O4859_06450, partial [Trichodesmium sp. St18_bin1]|nr:hypothetical protein [Trichodesmium sp. St18_bin1]
LLVFPWLWGLGWPHRGHSIIISTIMGLYSSNHSHTFLIHYRWIFQCFQVVNFLRINQSPKVVNLTEERSLILEFLPSSCQKYYLGNNNKKR